MERDATSVIARVISDVTVDKEVQATVTHMIRGEVEEEEDQGDIIEDHIVEAGAIHLVIETDQLEEKRGEEAIHQV